MRILGVRVHSLYNEEEGKISPVDHWRIHRPLLELKKHTDWDIDLVTKWVSQDDIKDVGFKFELDEIGRKYDIIFSSYLRNAWSYTLVKYLEDTFGTKYVMDIDDNLFNVSDWNPSKQSLLSIKHKDFGKPLREVDVIRSIVRDVKHLTVTTKPLRRSMEKIRTGSKGEVTVLKNLIPLSFYEHPGPKDNDTIVIGWQGSAHHGGDLLNTGFVEGLKQVLKDNPEVRFHTNTSFPVEEAKIPKDRIKVFKSYKGTDAWQKLFGRLRFDINCCPLEEHPFNDGKSNIKWQEGSLMGAASVCSQAYPYRRTVRHGEDGLLVPNTPENWQFSLEALVRDESLRKTMAAKAKQRVREEFSLEKNWTIYKDYFEGIMQEAPQQKETA